MHNVFIPKISMNMPSLSSVLSHAHGDSKLVVLCTTLKCNNIEFCYIVN